MSDESTGPAAGYNANLCAHCRNILDNWSKGFGRKEVHFPHYSAPDQVEQAAKDGCALCMQFIQGSMLGLEELKDMLDSRELQEFHGFVVIDDGIRRNRRGKLLPSEGIKLELAYEPVRKPDPAYALHTGFNFRQMSVNFVPAVVSEVSAVTHTRDSLGGVSRWLDACRNTHRRCNVHKDFTPSRLVSTEEGNVRLCVASDFAVPPAYATLSHCWGKAKIVCLETARLESFRAGIPLADLSRTFQDAIEIAREVGFQYIWLDSLCIVQDDLDDWLRESALMSSVYGHSGLNIAAAHGRDGTVGCFVQRAATWRCRVEVEENGQTKHYDCVPTSMYRKCVLDMPLADRGWVLQERLLPARTVHFTSTELLWECHEKTACETFPDQFPEPLAESQGYNFWAKEPLSRAMWEWVVDTYSEMELTFERDKLAAISGLARVIQSRTGDQYVAGMWRRDLEYQLCWTSGGGFAKAMPRAATYRAPTWSWVAMTGRIHTRNIEDWNEEEDATRWMRVQDVHLEFVGDDPFGLLSNAVLTVDASCLLRTRFQTSKSHEHSMMLGRELVRVTVDFDGFASIDEYNAACGKEGQSFVMPVFEQRFRPEGRITGLVLEPVLQERGQYRRAGVFYTDKGDMALLFRKAASNPLCRARETDVVRIWRDPDRTVHQLINIV